MDGCAPGQGDPGNDKDTTMRKRVWHAFAVLSLFGCAAWADAPEPVLAWPGSQEPMREEALFVTDDYPRLQGLAPVVRRYGGWHALAGMTFSAWFMVPADDAPVTLARFNSMPGTGSHRLHTITLHIPAQRVRGERQLRLAKHGGTHAAIPLPRELEGRWAHLALSFPRLTGAENPDFLPCTAFLNGKRTELQLHNALQNVLASVAIGVDGNARINRVALYDRPLDDAFTAQDAARATPRPTPPPSAPPAAAFHWTYGLKGTRGGWLSQAHRVRHEGGRELIPTPSGDGTSVRYYSLQSSIATQPLMSGMSGTAVIVGKMGRTPGSVLLCLGLYFQANTDTNCHHLNLKRGDGDEILLESDSPEIAFEPIRATVPDASTAFHCYAIRHDRGELSLWVDGRRMGAATIRFGAHADGLTVAAYQLGTVLGGLRQYVTPGADLEGFVADDLKFFCRALSDEEIGAVSKLLRVDGAPPPNAPRRQTRPTRPDAPRPAPDAKAGGARLPTLEPGRPLPTATERETAQRLLDELFDGEKVGGQDLLDAVRDAENDATRLALLTRAETAFSDGGDPAAALQTMALRERAFPGAVTDAEAAALLKEALRDTAVNAPDEALAHAQTVLAFATENNRPKLAQRAKTLTAQIKRYLAKSKDYADWEAALALAEGRLAAQAKLKDLRKAAEDGDPKACRLYGEALAKAGQWDDETLGALAVCDDPAVATLAADEAQEAPLGAKAALDLGERWWALADKTKDADLAHAYRLHAAELYETGKPAAKGLRRRLIEKRIEEAR